MDRGIFLTSCPALGVNGLPEFVAAALVFKLDTLLSFAAPSEGFVGCPSPSAE